MTIKEVCELLGITPDTLRYYEKAGAIPPVGRTAGGIRNYTEDDVNWINNAICLRGAGVSIEAVSEYVRLFQMGDETLQARCDLLRNAREEVLAAKAQIDQALDRLDYKVRKYEEAVETGVLNWDDEPNRIECHNK